MQRSENFKRYISGFFDGDGNITLEKLKDTGFTLRIKFCQSNEDWINTIQRYYPFLHISKGSKRNDNCRIEYQLRAAGKQIEPLIDNLLEYSILKYEQLLEAKEYLKLVNVKNKYDEKKNVYNKFIKLKENSINKPYDRLNIAYIAGLFDAEGSIGIYNYSLRVKITQKSDTVILQKIADMYNNKNKIDNYAISFYGINSLEFLTDVLPFCIYKVPQINSAIEYISTLNEELTDEILDIREHCENIIYNEKHVDININNLQFKNKENNEIFLRDAFKNFKNISYDDILLQCKMKEIEKTKENLEFESMIYNIDDWSNININPVLEFCEEGIQLNKYTYYRKKVSSLPLTGVIGRAIRILVKDSLSNKYIGLICLSSDVYNLGKRDEHIKKTGNVDWDNKEIKDKFLRCIANISCCVPFQPFGFNTTGGKLLASLVFSKEIFDYYLFKYKEPLLAIITTSINGKSVQYSGLECLEYIGKTKGFGSVNVPNNLYSVCKDYNNNWKVIKETGRVDRFAFLKKILTNLKLNQNILQHKKQRGIYFGYVFTTKFDNKYDINELKSVYNNFKTWKEKWCDKRIKNLIKNDKIKCDLDLYKIEYFEKLTFKKFSLPIIKEKILTDSLIKDVLTYKSKNNTQEEVAQILSKKYNINLLKGDISFIYLGKTLPKIKDEEYNILFNVKSFKKRNVSDEQIYYILDYYEANPNNSYPKIVEVFTTKYKQIISTATVSDIVLKKLNPIVVRQPKKEKVVINPKDKIDLLTKEQLLNVMNLKSNNTTGYASDYVKKNYDKYINRNTISKLWLNGIELSDDIKNTDEYRNMINNTKQRTVKPTKFSLEEKEYLKTITGTPSQRARLFEQKYNKTITREYVHKIIKNE